MKSQWPPQGTSFGFTGKNEHACKAFKLHSLSLSLTLHFLSCSYYPQWIAQYLLCRPKWLHQSSWIQTGDYSHNILKLRDTEKPLYLFTVFNHTGVFQIILQITVEHKIRQNSYSNSRKLTVLLSVRMGKQARQWIRKDLTAICNKGLGWEVY